MGHKRPDAAHFGAKLLDEREVGRQVLRRLEGEPTMKPAPTANPASRKSDRHAMRR